MFGAWSAAWPVIRSDLALSYVDVGLLFAVPHVLASLLEPLLGLLGDTWNRRALVRSGGLAFVAGLLLVANSGGFASLLLALILIFPASGAFVSLSQATLMDIAGAPRRQESYMALWTLAGSIGVVAGPLLVAAAAILGFGWRTAFVAMAGIGAVTLAVAWRAPGRCGAAPASMGGGLVDAAREAVKAARNPGVMRSLALLQSADLMLDVLHAFLALYFVDVVGATEIEAAFAVAAYTGIGLIGDLLVIPVLARIEGSAYVRVSAAAMLIVYPLFLWLDARTAKLVLLALIGLLNSGWYAVLQARLYAAMPGRSATVVALDSIAGLAGAALPLMVAAVADRAGLGAAMWLLSAGPVILLVGTRTLHQRRR